MCAIYRIVAGAESYSMISIMAQETHKLHLMSLRQLYMISQNRLVCLVLLKRAICS